MNEWCKYNLFFKNININIFEYVGKYVLPFLSFVSFLVEQIL